MTEDTYQPFPASNKDGSGFANLVPVRRLKNMGNGTFAEVIVAVNLDGSPIGSSANTDSYKLAQSEDLGTGTKYILKSSSTDWLMLRKTYTDTASEFAYASAENNASITLATAWTNRATLTYGTAAEAGA